MREFKFRAWNNEKKIMVYDNEDDSADYCGGVRYSDVGMINAIFSYPWITPPYDYMQYTGLKDKNGTEIYEGDIVDYFYDKSATIKWRNGGFIIESESCWESFHDVCADIEVIGNIYENPELL